jgi:hypothetical protein
MGRSMAAVALAGLLAAPALAGEARATFRVSVAVPAQVRLEALEQPAQLMLSDADVARGYVDVPARYRVRHNDRRGYLLQLAPRTGLARRVEVRGLGQPVVVADDSVEVHRAPGGWLDELDLAFRVVLGPGVRPGTYPLPVHLAAALL